MKRLEAEGTRLWLWKDLDCASRIFEITEFRAMAGCVFCSGEWTALGQADRHAFKGVSPGNITFAGDHDLLSELKTPKDCLNMADMPEAVRAAAQWDQVRGLVGAVCLDITPACGIAASIA